MKIVYISSPYFLDCDIPLISRLQKKADITYVLRLSNSTRKMSMLNIPEIKKSTGIYHANEFEGLELINRYINLKNLYIDFTAGSTRISYSNVKHVFDLMQFVKKNKFDIIHITWPLSYYHIPFYCLREKMIMTVHDPLPHSSSRDKLHVFERWMSFKMISKFIILNQTQKEDFINCYKLRKESIYESRLSVYYHLADIKPKESNESNYLLFFGQISSIRGLIFYVRQ